MNIGLTYECAHQEFNSYHRHSYYRTQEVSSRLVKVALFALWGLASILNVFSAFHDKTHWGHKETVVPFLTGAIIVNVACTFLLKKFGRFWAKKIESKVDTFLKWRTPQLNIFPSANKEHFLNAKDLQAVLKAPSLEFKTTALALMNSEQLGMVRSFMGVKSFQKITANLVSSPIQHWRSIDAIVTCKDPTKIQDIFTRLGKQKARVAFVPLVNQLEKELRKAGKKEVLEELYKIAPFVKPVTIPFADTKRPSLTVREELLEGCCPVHELLHQEELDSFIRVLKRLNGENVEATFDQWLTDLKFAHAKMSPRHFRQLEGHFKANVSITTFEEHCKVVFALKDTPSQFKGEFKKALENLYHKIMHGIDFLEAWDLAVRYQMNDLKQFLFERIAWGANTMTYVERMYRMCDPEDFARRFKPTMDVHTIKQIYDRYEKLDDPKAKLILTACFDFIETLSQEVKIKLWGPFTPQRKVT